MTFKVIITHGTEEGDEHTYYGVVFTDTGFSQPKELEYNSSLRRNEATFSFDDGKVPEGHHFLAILVGVDESEIGNGTIVEWKIGTNTSKHALEEVNF